MYVGEPILAVAAVSEQAAAGCHRAHQDRLRAAAVHVDPLESLFPGRQGCAQRRLQHRHAGRPDARQAQVDARRTSPASKPAKSCPWASRPRNGPSATSMREFKQVQGGATKRRFVTAVARASQHGAAQLHGLLAERQVLRARLAAEPVVRRCRRWRGMLGIKPEDLVLIAEYCGGGFGSKGARLSRAWRSRRYMSKKIGKPVMMRISRAEEYYLGSARNAFQGHLKVGFDARRQAAGRRRLRGAGQRRAHQLLGFPQRSATRWRCSTSPRPCAGAACRCSPMRRRAPRSAARARTSWPASWSRWWIARRASSSSTASRSASSNNPVNGSLGGVGRTASACRSPAPTSRTRSTRARAKFNWDERKKRSGQKNGPQGHRHRRRPGVPSRRLRRLRRPAVPHARRQAAHPHRRRQSRHVLAFGHLAHRRRSAQDRLGRTASSSAVTAARTCPGTSASSAATPRTP